MPPITVPEVTMTVMTHYSHIAMIAPMIAVPAWSAGLPLAGAPAADYCGYYCQSVGNGAKHNFFYTANHRETVVTVLFSVQVDKLQ